MSPTPTEPELGVMAGSPDDLTLDKGLGDEFAWLAHRERVAEQLGAALAALDADVRAGLSVELEAPLAPRTTTKVGGPALALVTVNAREALAPLLRTLRLARVPMTPLGNGSNVLIADRGVTGAVVVLGAAFVGTELSRDALGEGRHRLEVGAATSVTKLLRVAKQELLDGLQCLGGVPATLGGAVRMNAGTKAGELSDLLESALLATHDGEARWVPADELGLAYRHSQLPEGAVVMAARFVVTDADASMREALDEVLAYRKSTQPLTQPSCGSVFANPPGDAAGRLIEATGLKGAREGGAQVSEQHANWIVNTGRATAADYRALVDRLRAEVAARHGVVLRPEVQLVGDWADGWAAPMAGGDA